MNAQTETVESQREPCPNCEMQALTRPHGEDYVNCVACNSTFDVANPDE